MGRTQSYATLLKIIKEAVQLDLKMQQQKANFLLWGAAQLRKRNQVLYDPKLMEVRFGEVSKRTQYMELLIAPVLLKQGNADGRYYSDYVIIEKAQVDIAVPTQKRG
jgi:hypothetical protein